jgi:hypothetical protein
MLSPRAAPALGHLLFHGARGADALGWSRAAVSAMTLVYGAQYFRGVREETGSLTEAVQAYRTYRDETATV